MPVFTFEVTSENGVAVDVAALPSRKAAWCYVEFLASQLKSKRGARITVKDEAGGILIHAGAATALASIGWCADAACPLKAKPKPAD
ncbi:hypothetical protein [Methylocella sp.]|uniref:hypothetical protein n=1 Tax=Methylocella sp. TaxID=1978226 RepID=UPI0035B01384